MRNFLREEDGEAALSNRVLVPGTASIGINIGIDWYSKYWTNIFNTFRDPYQSKHCAAFAFDDTGRLRRQDSRAA